MRTLYRYFCILILPFFLISCANRPSPDSYDPKTFALGKKGIAILRTTEHAPQTFNKTNIALPYVLKKIGEDKALYVTGNTNFAPGIYNPQDYNSNMMMLDPGVYYIDYLTLHGTQYITRWYPGPGIKKINSAIGNKYLVTIGAFEIKPGQVLYLGHANMRAMGNLPFNIINEIDQVKADLKEKGFNNLANKVEFKPLFQIGSIIIEKNGDFLFIDSELIEQAKLASLGKITEELITKARK